MLPPDVLKAVSNFKVRTALITIYAAGLRISGGVAKLTSLALHPLDRAGGFAGHVIDHTVDAAHFVDDTHRDAAEELGGKHAQSPLKNDGP